MVNSIKAHSIGLICLEYTMNGLKIRTTNNADHDAFLKAWGIEFYTHDPNPSQQVKYILRGLPPSTEDKEIKIGLREKGVAVTHVRQLKRNVVEDEMRVVKLLPMLIVKRHCRCLPGHQKSI